ncbi:MAG: hypothetical protein BGO77_01925 [Caedibacter sp. 37-49]|nr:MAG: hypothetical protein BGO77_01925 [Caedibacter sp. 37-49]
MRDGSISHIPLIFIIFTYDIFIPFLLRFNFLKAGGPLLHSGRKLSLFFLKFQDAVPLLRSLCLIP